MIQADFRGAAMRQEVQRDCEVGSLFWRVLEARDSQIWLEFECQ